MSKRVILGKRRFTCLSPTLVRMEFAPDGDFEDRRSLAAYAEQQPRAFRSRRREGEWTVLTTEALEIRTREDERDFTHLNLEVRWLDEGLLQYWRPGDRDYRNLGGTVRSLDRYGAGAPLGGAHVADLESPDDKGTAWLAWLQCEEDPPYYKASPTTNEKAGRGNHHRVAVEDGPAGQLLHRSLNWTRDAHRYCPGVLSRSGYFLLNDSDGAVLDADDFPVERRRPGSRDWYFFGYGKEYGRGLEDFILLSGPAPLPPRQAFGIIFSRWPAYDEAEARSIVETFAERGHPLSVLVLDMEWHTEGWGTWDWNDSFYPDPAAFLQWCHDRGLQVTLNDHPLDVREDDSHFAAYVKRGGPAVEVREIEYDGKRLQAARVDVCNKRQARALSETCHRPVLEQGVDFWWNDGYRGERAGLIGQQVMNKLSFEEVDTPEHRGMLLARYGGVGSHRYGGFFTGDTSICWEVLAMQVEFDIRAGHLGLAYVSHDIGGFCTGGRIEIIDPELYLRWVQFGVFNPLLRFHSAPSSGSRQPWDYDPHLRGAARRWLRLRNSLLPYIYSAAREHYETGLPLVRGLFLEAPETPAAYRFDEYLFGPSFLCAPVTGPERRREVYLPAGEWYEYDTGKPVAGGRSFNRRVAVDRMPVYARAGSIIPRQDPDREELHAPHLDPLWLDVFPGAAGEAVLYEDDGVSGRYRGSRFCKTRLRLARRGKTLTLSGEKAAGRPFGATRRLRVRVPLAERPSAVRLDGRKLPDAAVEQERKGWVCIDVPAVKAGGSFKLTVTPRTESR